MANDIFLSILIPASGIVPLIISVAVLVKDTGSELDLIVFGRDHHLCIPSRFPFK